MSEPNPIFARQASLGLTIPRAVAVVGCGGVGSWTALFLALAGTPQLYLFDHDTVSDSNLNRLLVTADTVGKGKAESVADMIRRYRPECDILPLGLFSPTVANAIKLADKIDWLVCTTDTLASRRECHKWCLHPPAPAPKFMENTSATSIVPPAMPIPIRYVEAAAEGEFGSATGSPAEWASDLEAAPGYESVPVHVGPCVFAAAMAVNHVIHNTPMPYVIRTGFDGSRMTTLIAND